MELKEKKLKWNIWVLDTKTLVPMRGREHLYHFDCVSIVPSVPRCPLSMHGMRKLWRKCYKTEFKATYFNQYIEYMAKFILNFIVFESNAFFFNNVSSKIINQNSSQNHFLTFPSIDMHEVKSLQFPSFMWYDMKIRTNYWQIRWRKNVCQSNWIAFLFIGNIAAPDSWYTHTNSSSKRNRLLALLRFLAILTFDKWWAILVNHSLNSLY